MYNDRETLGEEQDKGRGHRIGEIRHEIKVNANILFEMIFGIFLSTFFRFFMTLTIDANFKSELDESN